MMYILALAFLMQMSSQAPILMSPPTDGDSCFSEAQKRNQDPRLKTEEARAVGAMFVCLHVEFPV